MSRIVVQTTPEGFSVSPRMLRDVGIQPGEAVEVVIRPLPGKRRVMLRALGECVRRYGDAIGVRDPRWNTDDGQWEVDLIVRGRDEVLGHLYADGRGQILEDRLPTREALLALCDAVRTKDQAA